MASPAATDLFAKTCRRDRQPFIGIEEADLYVEFYNEHSIFRRRRFRLGEDAGDKVRQIIILTFSADFAGFQESAEGTMEISPMR